MEFLRGAGGLHFESHIVACHLKRVVPSLTDFYLSFVTEDIFLIQAVRATKGGVTLTVSLANPQPGAVYTVQAFADAPGTQPDGEAVLVSSAGRSGTAADPFTFTWPYTAGASGDRWFMIKVDEDGSGPGGPSSSNRFGPVPLGKHEWLFAVHQTQGCCNGIACCCCCC